MLLEALIAILIFSIGILALVGLQAGTVANATDARFRSEAALLAQEMVSRLMLDQATAAALNNYSGNPPADWSARVAARLPSGVGKISVVTNDANAHQPEAEVEVDWTSPGGGSHSFITTAAILKSKPLP